MDQQKAAAKPKNKILKFLPRATSSVSFQNPPLYSPAKDKRSSEKTHKSNLGIGFSGPMVSMIRADTSRKSKNDSDYTVVYEPTSPRVSCMGQVKCKYQREKLQRHGNSGAANKPPIVVKSAKKDPRTTSFTAARKHNVEDDHEGASKTEGKGKNKLGLKKIFGGGTGSGGGGRKSDAGNNKSKAPLYLDKVPSLSTMKRFSSGRDKFSNIDWTKHIAAMDSGHRSYHSEEESGGESDDEEVIVPSSAPVVIRNKGIDDSFIRVGGLNLEPRKEINLWKRRTMPQPKPLQLHDI